MLEANDGKSNRKGGQTRSDERLRHRQPRVLESSIHQPITNCHVEVTALGEDHGAERTEHTRDTDPDRTAGSAAERAGAAHDRVRAGYSDPQARETQQAREHSRGSSVRFHHCWTSGVCEEASTLPCIGRGWAGLSFHWGDGIGWPAHVKDGGPRIEARGPSVSRPPVFSA